MWSGQHYTLLSVPDTILLLQGMPDFRLQSVQVALPEHHQHHQHWRRQQQQQNLANSRLLFRSCDRGHKGYTTKAGWCARKGGEVSAADTTWDHPRMQLKQQGRASFDEFAAFTLIKQQRKEMDERIIKADKTPWEFVFHGPNPGPYSEAAGLPAVPGHARADPSGVFEGGFHTAKPHATPQTLSRLCRQGHGATQTRPGREH